MAKTYTFRIALRQAEIGNCGGLAYTQVIYGGTQTLYRVERSAGTLAEAVARRDELSAAEPRCHQASIAMAVRGERKPAGFDALPWPVHADKGSPL